MGRLLHFDCFSGVSGDMTLGALLDLGVPEADVRQAVDSLGLPGKLRVEKVRKNGFAATKVTVDAEPEQKHRHLSHIHKILDGGTMTEGARDLARRMFDRLGIAEAESHGIPIAKVHFHEVGAVDSIFDFVGVAVGIDALKPSRITARPVPVGNGWVECDHGRLPIPAPATARLLQGIPIDPSPIQGELTTPTGAAILATLVTEYVAQPAIKSEAVGLGAGTRDLKEQPNLLRLFLGESLEAPFERDLVWELQTNVDRDSPEIVGYCLERLLDAGALDAFATGVQMKKSRPGTLITVLCDSTLVARMEEILFRETSTLGIRRIAKQRSKLSRRIAPVDTPWGSVRVKWSERASGEVLPAPEYEDCARIARSHDLPFREVYQWTLNRAVEAENSGSRQGG